VTNTPYNNIGRSYNKFDQPERFSAHNHFLILFYWPMRSANSQRTRINRLYLKNIIVDLSIRSRKFGVGNNDRFIGTNDLAFSCNEGVFF